MTRYIYGDLAAPLGTLVIAFNELEVSMGGALMRILKNEDDFVGSVFVSILGFRQKYALLVALAIKIENSSVRSELFDLLEAAKTISERRNRFVHAEYTPVKNAEDVDKDVSYILHQRLKDFAKENHYSSSRDVFTFITPARGKDISELADEASQVAFSLLQVSERFYPTGE